MSQALISLSMNYPLNTLLTAQSSFANFSLLTFYFFGDLYELHRSSFRHRHKTHP